jgi:hypothetical protein
MYKQRTALPVVRRPVLCAAGEETGTQAVGMGKTLDKVGEEE